MPGQYNFSFNVINELYANFMCSICKESKFSVRYKFSHKIRDVALKDIPLFNDKNNKIILDK